jgi:hypothetical protein
MERRKKEKEKKKYSISMTSMRRDKARFIERSGEEALQRSTSPMKLRSNASALILEFNARRPV